MLFTYKAVTKAGGEISGEIDAPGQDAAINALQRSGLVVISVRSTESKGIFNMSFDIFNRVKPKDIAIISRQIATLLGAHVPALKTFRFVASESENPIIAKTFTAISDDVQNGIPISEALGKHPDMFSDFYVNMVRGGEESGGLSETFIALADQLERSTELMGKARGALIYPAFVVLVFFVVMGLLLTLVVPKLADIITQSGQAVPIYTSAIIGLSSLLVHYGFFVLMAIVAAAFLFWRYTRNSDFVQKAKLWTPVIGTLYRMLYLMRIADNMNVMLINGISMVRSLEITAKVVDDKTYQAILQKALADVKGGAPLSVALGGKKEIPQMMVQMIKVGEETGELGVILQKVAVLYQHEVSESIASIISLIEPAMIVALGLGVGIVFASVLIPVYQIAGNV
jgi:type II secretory pathway component PulF